MGAHGTQYQCYTNQAPEYVQPKAPSGGGFGCEVITLDWLYKQYLAHNNIWTTSNEYKDLCRYTGCKITFYRHEYIDWIIAYDNQAPFDLNKYTYAEIQPQNMLLRKHKRILLSKQTKPNGKTKLTIKVGPPKQMLTKWFFQRDFCKADLLKLSAASASFLFPNISHGSQGPIFTAYALNTTFYANSNWLDSSQQTQGYVPFTGAKFPMYFKYSERGQDKKFTYNPTQYSTNGYTNPYYQSISYNHGLFSPKVLFAKQIVQGADPGDATADWANKTGYIASLPIIPLRYNPHLDTGHGNQVYLTSLLRQHYDKPTVTQSLFFDNVPLYTAYYGYADFIIQDTKDKGVLDTHMFITKCEALHPISQNTKQSYYPLIDIDYASGKLPWDEYLSQKIKNNWYPTAEWQKITMNNFVTSGPYVPKFDPGDRDSTWQLNYKYQFFFKWGGPEVTDPAVEDPCTRKKYNVPDTVLQGLQISNPQKLHTDSLLHEWDFRRGFITARALKRMSENLPTDSSLQSDDSETPKKKRKTTTKELTTTQAKQEEIKNCLLSLCEEPTCQEETEDLHQLIKQQQQQQQLIKRNILKLITHLRKEQRVSQLQTGLLE